MISRHVMTAGFVLMTLISAYFSRSIWHERQLEVETGRLEERLKSLQEPLYQLESRRDVLKADLNRLSRRKNSNIRLVNGIIGKATEVPAKIEELTRKLHELRTRSETFEARYIEEKKYMKKLNR